MIQQKTTPANKAKDGDNVLCCIEHDETARSDGPGDSVDQDDCESIKDELSKAKSRSSHST